ILIPTTDIDEISQDKHRVLLRTEPGRAIAASGHRMAPGRPRLGGVGISADAVRGCRDYAVDSPDGHIGTVNEIRYAGDSHMPSALAIRAGRAGSRLLIVPISQVTSFRAVRHRITVRASTKIIKREPIVDTSAI